MDIFTCIADTSKKFCLCTVESLHVISAKKLLKLEQIIKPSCTFLAMPLSFSYNLYFKTITSFRSFVYHRVDDNENSRVVLWNTDRTFLFMFGNITKVHDVSGFTTSTTTDDNYAAYLNIGCEVEEPSHIKVEEY